MAFKKHRCKLGLGSDSMLPREDGLVARLYRSIRKLSQISQHHPETFDRFSSYPVIMAERQRQLYEGGSCLIHPFSLSSLIWISIMAIVNLAHMCCSTFRLSYIIAPVTELKPHFVDWIILGLNFFCWIDIIVRFNTGYAVGKLTDIVLVRAMITWRYLVRWFLIDLLSCLPVALIILHWYPHKSRHLLMAHVLPLLRCARIYTVIQDMKTILKTCTKSYIWHGCVRHVVVFVVSCHWCSCVIYLPPVMSLYWYGTVPLKYTSFLDDGSSAKSIMHYNTDTRYKKSIFISLSTFFGTGFSLFRSSQHDEILVHSLVILYAAIFMVYNFVFLLKVHLTVYSSTIRYHALTNQVEEYMRHKQFPIALKKRVRAFYYYRYHERYFNEENVLNCLSEGLRNEITFHTCSKLVEKVRLFQDVPAHVMGSILGCLRPEVYMPNEFVMQGGEIGHCMFFVANGTIAIYSLKGAEVCHVEDGEYFGEVALLMKDSKRVTTAMAIEITLLYHLNSDDFKQYIMKNELMSDRIEALASWRMHEAVMRDENYDQTDKQTSSNLELPRGTSQEPLT